MGFCVFCGLYLTVYFFLFELELEPELDLELGFGNTFAVLRNIRNSIFERLRPPPRVLAIYILYSFIIVRENHLEKYNSFQSIIPVMEDGMKKGIDERRGGVWNPAKRDSDEGAGIQLLRNPKDFERILMTGGFPL